MWHIIARYICGFERDERFRVHIFTTDVFCFAWVCVWILVLDTTNKMSWRLSKYQIEENVHIVHILTLNLFGRRQRFLELVTRTFIEKFSLLIVETTIFFHWIPQIVWFIFERVTLFIHSLSRKELFIDLQDRNSKKSKSLTEKRRERATQTKGWCAAV